MLFTSPVYYIFLIAVLLLFAIAKDNRYRKLVLILASAVFCTSFSWTSFLVLLCTSLINYVLLSKLYGAADKKVKSKLYHAGVVLNVLILFSYKLLQLLIPESDTKADVFHEYIIILGLSFYILQSIGYYVEVYKRKVPFAASFPDFFLSLAFFAKLPEGPILRINQLKEVASFQSALFWNENISYGIQRILLGVFKKVALADRLGPYVHQVFDEHKNINGLTVYLAPVLFTMQLYFDFSGFMDIAIGSAKLFGIRLPENFHLPLRATSVTEFWRRWHITLIEWLTNYIFYPISFRLRKLRQKGLIIAVVATFLISAAWHGLAITFFIWATCHIIYIVLEHWLFKGTLAKVKVQSPARRIGRVFLVWQLVAFANLFFRSESLKDAGKMINDFARMPFLYKEGESFRSWLVNGGQDIEAEFNYRLTILLCILFLVFEKKINQYATSEKYRVTYVAAMLVMIAVFGLFNNGQNFLYTRF